MTIYADLHLHSKYSRATSKNLDLKSLEKYGKLKGLNLIGTGDFQHPLWNKELKQQLTEEGSGILASKTGFSFLLTTEISLIYKQDGKGRRNHLVLFVPDFATGDQVTEYLLSKGRIDYDGRPIFKVPCNDFVYDLKQISKDIEIIPAHIWTPHFSVMGDYNQYENIKECFKDQLHHIHALETGISSDPPMNWRLSQLDQFNLVSFSDSHSFWPWRLGREATLFESVHFSYASLIKAIRSGDGLLGTVESEPNFGKYHFTGHRKCDVCIHAKDAQALDYRCPKCQKKMAKGVHDRIEELADRKEGYVRPNAKPFYSLIPLHELIAAYLGTSVTSKKVQEIHAALMKKGGNEFHILLEMNELTLRGLVDPQLAKAILLNREGKIRVQPGYDGVYGIPLLKGEKVETYHPTEDELKLAHAAAHKALESAVKKSNRTLDQF